MFWLVKHRQLNNQDWCTLWPDGGWGHCCYAHDQTGVNLQSNLDLFDCVWLVSPGMAIVMFAGVMTLGYIYRTIQDISGMAKVTLDKGDTRLIIAEAKKRSVLRNQLAYILATTLWETAHKMKPIREMGGEKYLKSKKYYPYVGMGYVQLTWRTNYKKASHELGVDFVANPKLLLKPEYAKVILVVGMIEGWFTGKKLSDYITLEKSDFVNARRIINGTDKKHEIAKLAREYDYLLLLEGYGVEAVEPAKPVVTPETEAALDDADKPLGQSTTFWRGVVGAILAPILAVVQNPMVQAMIVVMVFGIVVWGMWDRKRKAKLARQAKASNK